MSELEQVTWNWKRSLDGSLIAQEPEYSKVDHSKVCACTSLGSFMQWLGGRFELNALIEAGFKMCEYEVDSDAVTLFSSINQAYFKTYKTKKEIDLKYIKRELYGL